MKLMGMYKSARNITEKDFVIFTKVQLLKPNLLKQQRCNSYIYFVLSINKNPRISKDGYTRAMNKRKWISKPIYTSRVPQGRHILEAK